ncbi:hypothetical protein G6F56_000856 [Rhizopus delemar]|nr:hypothetical protein G6F56_000856 [Rhizopus delemar]
MTFTTVIDNLYVPYQPKLSAETIAKLKSMNRTFWIDKVIPIFQSIGDQTGLLGFEWCEKIPQSHVQSVMDTDAWKLGTSRNVDGLGYNLYDEDLFVLEASSGQDKEDITHTKDDTLKNIHSSISILNALVRKFQDGRFSTATNLRTFSVQSVCSTITLCSTSFDPDNIGGYIHEELRFADIPMTYNDRYKWLKVFELVVKLVGMLRKQTIVHQ